MNIIKKHTYKFFNFEKIKIKEYEISNIYLKDIEKIRLWRNKQIKILRQKSLINKIQQKKYFDLMVLKNSPKKNPSIILFSFCKNKKIIGYGGLTNINWKNKNAELSFLLDNKRVQKSELYKKEFNIYLLLVKKFLTKYKIVSKLHAFTFVNRKKHIDILEKFGFFCVKKIVDKSKKSLCFKHILEI